MTDPTDGPFGTRQQAEAVFAHFRRGAERGTYGPASQFLADALADSIHVFDVQLGEYDRQLIARLAQLLDPVDVAVICGRNRFLRRRLGRLAEQTGDGRLTARPRATVTTTTGTRALGLDRERDAILRLPPNATGAALPLLVLFHGAGGSADGVLRR